MSAASLELDTLLLHSLPAGWREVPSASGASVLVGPPFEPMVERATFLAGAPASALDRLDQAVAWWGVGNMWLKGRIGTGQRQGADAAYATVPAEESARQLVVLVIISGDAQLTISMLADPEEPMLGAWLNGLLVAAGFDASFPPC